MSEEFVSDYRCPASTPPRACKRVVHPSLEESPGPGPRPYGRPARFVYQNLSTQDISDDRRSLLSTINLVVTYVLLNTLTPSMTLFFPTPTYSRLLTLWIK